MAYITQSTKMSTYIGITYLRDDFKDDESFHKKTQMLDNLLTKKYHPNDFMIYRIAPKNNSPINDVYKYVFYIKDPELATKFLMLKFTL
jgi:hypothetical protein